MANPYEVLGVSKSASDEEIRSVYRKLAKAHHPDLNPGNKQAELRFKEISSAYGLLKDPEKRRRYDAGEIDEAGNERPPERRAYRHYAEAEPGFRYGSRGGGGEFDDLGGVFSDLFGRGSDEERHGHLRMRGQDRLYRLLIGLLDAAGGATKRIDLPDGKTLDVKIPAGVAEGQILRLAGMGGPGIGGGPPGDALVEIGIAPHPVFQRDGDTIRSVVPITLREAIAGGSIRIDTVSGPVDLKIPKGSSSGRVLRLKGKGMPGQRGRAPGDHLAELRIVLPDRPGEELERLVSEWEARHPYDPRAKGGGS
ncbi:MAG: J domain-containing protein [Hyphomicrobiaceae bacterium]